MNDELKKRILESPNNGPSSKEVSENPEKYPVEYKRMLEFQKIIDEERKKNKEDPDKFQIKNIDKTLLQKVDLHYNDKIIKEMIEDKKVEKAKEEDRANRNLNAIETQTNYQRWQISLIIISIFLSVASVILQVYSIFYK